MKKCRKMILLDFKACFVAAPGAFAYTKVKDGQGIRDLEQSSDAAKGITDNCNMGRVNKKMTE